LDSAATKRGSDSSVNLFGARAGAAALGGMAASLTKQNRER